MDKFVIFTSCITQQSEASCLCLYVLFGKQGLAICFSTEVYDFQGFNLAVSFLASNRLVLGQKRMAKYNGLHIIVVKRATNCCLFYLSVRRENDGVNLLGACLWLANC